MIIFENETIYIEYTECGKIIEARTYQDHLTMWIDIKCSLEKIISSLSAAKLNEKYKNAPMSLNDKRHLAEIENMFEKAVERRDNDLQEAFLNKDYDNWDKAEDNS